MSWIETFRNDSIWAVWLCFTVTLVPEIFYIYGEIIPINPPTSGGVGVWGRIRKWNTNDAGRGGGGGGGGVGGLGIWCT